MIPALAERSAAQTDDNAFVQADFEVSWYDPVSDHTFGPAFPNHFSTEGAFANFKGEIRPGLGD